MRSAAVWPLFDGSLDKGESIKMAAQVQVASESAWDPQKSCVRACQFVARIVGLAPGSPRGNGLSASNRFSAKLLRNRDGWKRGTVVPGRRAIFERDSEGVVHLGTWRLISHLFCQGRLTLPAVDSGERQKDARSLGHPKLGFGRLRRTRSEVF